MRELIFSLLLLFPSEAETFGMVALESVACGRPVAAYPVGGIPEVVIEGQTGALAAEKGPEYLTAAVIRILNRQSDEWVKSCRNFFEDHVRSCTEINWKYWIFSW